MPFHWIPGEERALVKKARLDVLSRIGELCVQAEAEFVVVAGDLFDANTVDDRLIVQTCDLMRSIERPVYVLPGNHDHGGADSVYRSDRFRHRKPNNMHVLLNQDPVPVGDALLLPAPLLRRHETDSTRHINQALGRDIAPNAIRLGLAHGSVRDFSGQPLGESPNHLDLDLVRRAELDYLALGDWHGLKQVDERAWYPGAPEPTGFKENDPGYALVVNVDRPGAMPRVESSLVARTRWLRHEARVMNHEQVLALGRWFDALPDPGNTLVRLELDGVLPLEDCTLLERVLKDAEGRLLHLRRRGRGVLPAPTSEELGSLASDGYVRAAIERLRGNPDETAARALQLLWRLRAEAR